MDDGGPAFPQLRTVLPDGSVISTWNDGMGGISIRDWLAGQAPPMTEQWWSDSRGDGHHYLEATAAWNYAFADAMLAERGRKQA